MGVIIISPWAGAGSQFDPRRPAVLDLYPGGVQIGDPSAARCAVRYAAPPAALLADWRFARVPADQPDPLSVEAYRAALLAALDLWRESRTATVGGVTLRSRVESQREFTALATATLTALQVGAWTQATETWVYDAAGARIDLTVGELLALLAGYAATVQAQTAAYYATGAAITAAQSAADLDAITFGG